MKIKLRASNLDRLPRCSHFVRYSTEDIKRCVNKQALRGTLIHKQAENNIETIDTSFYLNYLNKECVLEKELYFENDDFILTGTCDAYRLTDDRLEIIDLKTGQIDVPATSLQLLGYAFMLSKTLNHEGAVKVSIIQHGVIKSLDVKPLLCHFETMINDFLKDADKPKLGSQCLWCNALSVCKAVNNIVDKAVIDLEKNNMNLKHLKNYKIILKYIETLKGIFENTYPEKVKYDYRSFKVWKEKPTDDKFKEVMSPTKALKNGYLGDGIIEVKTKYLKGYDVE